MNDDRELAAEVLRQLATIELTEADHATLAECTTPGELARHGFRVVARHHRRELGWLWQSHHAIEPHTDRQVAELARGDLDKCREAVRLSAETAAVLAEGFRWFADAGAGPACSRAAVLLDLSRPAADVDAEAVTALVEIDRWLADLDDHDTTKDDTKNDHGKKTQKKRGPRKMNAAAADCARRYRADSGQFPMKSVVEDYVAERGGSVATLMRILNDNPDQWKDDHGTT